MRVKQVVFILEPKYFLLEQIAHEDSWQPVSPNKQLKKYLTNHKKGIIDPIMILCDYFFYKLLNKIV